MGDMLVGCAGLIFSALFVALAVAAVVEAL